MFSKSAKFYDAQYYWKRYSEEAEQVARLIRARVPEARTLLDVACGTGAHMLYLAEYGFACEGLDLDEELLSIARDRLPGTPLHIGDMQDFDLGRTFDAVVCLFSAIGYADGVKGLNRTLTCLTRHVRPGGVVIVEPWLSPEVYQVGKEHAMFVDLPDIKLARMTVSRVEGRASVLDFKFLVMADGKIQRFEESHRIFLFTDEEYRQAFLAAGLEVEVDTEGISGRGLYIGTKRNPSP